MKKVGIIRKILALVVAVCVAMEFIVVPGGAQKVQAAVTSGDYEYVVLTDATTIRLSKYNGTDAEVDIPETIDGKRVVEIGTHAFENCTNLKRVYIPYSVTNIGNYAFYLCTNLEWIGIPASVKSIEDHAFALCKNMTGIAIENGLTSIGNSAFYECDSLAEITLPDSVTHIGNSVCEGCIALSKIYYSGTEEQWENLGIGSETGNEVLQNAAKEYGWVLEADAVKNYEYELVEGGDESVRIIKYIGPGSNTVVNIPRNIGGWNVTSIGQSAFSGCTGLEEISISDHVTSIDESVFDGCTGLKKITIPDSVLSIKKNAFRGCTGLSNIYYSGERWQWWEISENEETDLTGNEQLSRTTIHYADVTEYASGDYRYEYLDDGSIGITKYNGAGSNVVLEVPEKIDGLSVTGILDGAFSGCVGLREVTIPDSVTAGIGCGAFRGCTGLMKVNLPNSITEIYSTSFSGCTSLNEIIIPDGVTSIDYGAFEGCTGLAQITIPVSVTRIDENAFDGCTALKDVYYTSTSERWGKITVAAAGNELLNAATIHCSGTSDSIWGDYRYKTLDDGTIEITKYIGASSNKIVDIPKSINGVYVTSIGQNAFCDCAGLEKITIPDSVENIASLAFQNCTGLKELVFPDRLTSLGSYAFSGCSALEEIELPAGITKLDICMFQNCTALVKVKIPDSVTEVAYGAFNGCKSLAEITVPNGVTTIAASVFDKCTSLGKITIPGSVASIGENVFYGCTGLSDVYYSGPKEQWGKIEIGSDVKGQLSKTTIHYADFTEYVSGNYRYQYLDDGTIEITDYLGESSGTGTGAVVESIPEKIEGKSVARIGASVFSECTGLKEISLPAGITGIGDSAFQGCSNLAVIMMPISVANINKEAFDGCTNLSEIYYPGTEEQWNKIKILEGNEPVQKATIHYNHGTDPDIPEEPQEEVVSAKEALESLKAGDALSLDPAFQPYLSPEQIDIMESYLYTWLAEVNYAYKYSGNSGIKERIMKKAGIDPEGDFASGKEQAITHISVETKYKQKTFEITLELGKPDSGGNLYPAYGAMHYEVIPEENIPSDVPKSGQFGKSDYTGIGTFVQCVSKAAEDSLHGTYQWQSLSDEMAAGILSDKTITEIIGNKNGSFSDGTFTIYAKPLLTYSKKVTIACPVDVRVYTMEGKEAGAIINNEKFEKDGNVGLHVEGDVKAVYLAGNDYYLNLLGTDTGKMRYEVEEIANDKICRDVQFLELQLKKDLQYEGYVFRPLNIDSDLYALRKKDGSNEETILSNKDTYEALFKKVQGLSLSHGEATLDQNRSVQLNASLYPLDASNQSLQWTSNNQSVLSVDGNGLVKAVGAGSATVTVSTRDGSFLKQYCVINVKGGGGNSGGTGGSGGSGGTGGSGSSGSTGGSGNAGGSGNSGSSGNSGNGTNGSGDSENNSDGSDNKPDDNKPSLEPETPPVVVALHYVLQFQTNGGINLSRKTMTLLADDNPGIMPKIQRKGYVFDGWYTQQNGGEQVKGDEPLKVATTLYAHWTKAEAPKKASAPTLKSKKKGQMKISFKKVKGAAGYQLQYSTKKGFASKKTKQIGASAKAKTISGLKAGKKYYARVRAYSTDSMGNKMYGKYSKAKSVKIKA